MLTETNFAENRKNLAARLRGELSLSASPSAWTLPQRAEYNKAFAAFIIGHPDSFSAADLERAQAVYAARNEPLSPTGILANLGSFGDALLTEAGGLNSDLNPFSEKNRKILFWLVVAGAAVYVLAPVIARAVAARKAAP